MRRAGPSVLILLTASIISGWLSDATSVGYASQPKNVEEEVKHLIVMISGQIRGTPTIGAGIIFGVGPDRLYIATANHVVRRGIYEAQDLRVTLRSRSGEPLRARLLDKRDDDLDLAVLTVAGLERQAISVDALPLDRLGDAGVLQRGDEVYHVGYPYGNAWRVNVTPDKISEMVGSVLGFESNSIAPGNSGGGLFNKRWELVGMVRADQPPDGQAVSVQSILGTLSQWGYPVSLTRQKRSELIAIFFNDRTNDMSARAVETLRQAGFKAARLELPSNPDEVKQFLGAVPPVNSVVYFTQDARVKAEEIRDLLSPLPRLGRLTVEKQSKEVTFFSLFGPEQQFLVYLIE